MDAMLFNEGMRNRALKRFAERGVTIDPKARLKTFTQALAKMEGRKPGNVGEEVAALIRFADTARSDGLPVREFRPLTMDRGMIEAMSRINELHPAQSLYAKR